MLPSRAFWVGSCVRVSQRVRALHSGGVGKDAPARLSHVDDTGRARMVDVGAKPGSLRTAIASAEVVLGPSAFAALTASTGDDLRTAKGDVFSLAQAAGILAAKQTPNLVPLCHHVPLSSVSIALSLDHAAASVRIQATARTSPTAQTGVEMEALTAASVAALTVYDMCKSANKAILIRDVRLLRKTGGASGDYCAADSPKSNQSTTASDCKAA